MKPNKVKISVMFILLISVILVGCSSKEKSMEEISEQQEAETLELVTTERKYNNDITYDDLNDFTNLVVDYSTSIGDIFSDLLDMTTKYANEINNDDIFDWSQHWDYRELKADSEALCQEILNTDDSWLSCEMQLCIDEFKSMANKINLFFELASEETDVYQLEAINNDVVNAVVVGMNNALVYDTMAIISYNQANGADASYNSELISQIEDSDIFKGCQDVYTSVWVSDQNRYEAIFSNNYGTYNTQCAHIGCSNIIASSGNSNCCVVHSNKCYNCGAYIDEDAVYCTECLSNAFSSATNKCEYRYLNGSVCGRQVDHYSTLCDEHFTLLLEVYLFLLTR